MIKRRRKMKRRGKSSKSKRKPSGRKRRRKGLWLKSRRRDDNVRLKLRNWRPTSRLSKKGNLSK